MMRFPPCRALLVACCLFVIPKAVRAQLGVLQFSVDGGLSHFVLNGSGTAPVGDIRLNIPLFALNLEGAVGVMHTNEDDGSHTYAIPEAQLQIPFFPFIVRPYIGLGGGLFDGVSGPEPRKNAGFFSVSGGVRIAPPLVGIGLRGEVRYRAIGSRVGNSTTDFTIGVSF